MSEHVERLKASHFDEAMSFLNEVFAVHGPHDFARMLPGIYRPDDEHMQNNLALRRDGRLIAVVGVFPITLRAGNSSLRVAGIGGVSVAPDQRGQGLLERIMALALQTIREDAYPLSFLNGRRHRYRRFGWEVAGADLHFSIAPRNLARSFAGSPQPEVTLEPLNAAPAEALARELLLLHAAQPIHAERSLENFPRLLQSWHHQTFVARNPAGTVLGYVSGERVKGLVTELVATSSEAAMSIVRALGPHFGDRIELTLRALPSPLTDELGRVAERVELRASGNWQLWDFGAVAAALLQVRHAARPLPEGRVVLKASGSAESHALWVEGDRAGCEPVHAAPDLELPRDELLRLVFGPLPPSFIAPLARGAELLSSWCPLPLALSAQDHV